jgi:ribonuclease-3
MSSPFEELEKKLSITFKDRELLKQVFTHRSYLNEAGDRNLVHNERLEFLGDAVLELVVTDHLYKSFNNPEGELTNWRSAVVRGEVIGRVAYEMKLGDYLLLSKGEEKSGGRERTLILANTFEAFIGAIYLDQGYKAASDFIHKYLIILLPEIIEKKLYIDAKSRLQELSQEVLGHTPDYKVTDEKGPDHDKIFTVTVVVGKKPIAEGTGASKQKAEQDAAANAIERWEEIIQS